MLAVRDVAPPTPPHGLTAHPHFNPLALLPIFEEAQQVCMVPRTPDPAIHHYLAQSAHKMVPGYRMVLNTRQAIQPQLASQLALVVGHGKEALLADMAHIATVYADLLDCPHIGLRLEVLSQAMCPKFHIDRTGIRLLCTYLGPGTEWLDEAYCNRNAFATPNSTLEAFHQALIVHPQGICQASEQALVLLKGSLWQGNQHAGAVHRSPQIETGSTRVVLALDAIW
ncbi:DUF1826 domain-containing protein [Methylophilus aquaticus]|uniref:DUF1826 domain-containing protein n=1 Tax=Methylophilus aquaticus TaxID=1971610 RepID=A0ABT9JXP0_9PROT|nr:DUF1826 domain-containing protein [Methylophilus aquaticus]MDP8568705.1 DUF1826 domain-containing protein [Methylophilus aquaticus]